MKGRGKGGLPLVLVGVGLGALYWVIESMLYLFLSNDLNFFNHLFHPDESALYRRIIVLALFVIFGSHSQSRMKGYQEEIEEWMAYSSHLESPDSCPPGSRSENRNDP